MYAEVDQSLPVVQKYGGTSVGDVPRIRRIAERVSRQYAKGWKKIAVVVSAMSGETNRLIELVRQANPGARTDTKSYDTAVAAGEQVSVGLMAAALESFYVPAEPFLAHQAGILTDRSHGRARIHSIRSAALENCWERGAIPVIAGFQGVTDMMEITTLGRGGSDTSAVALAAAIGASFCEINTDVAGVYTADPRYVPGARLIESLDYETALELAALGGKVLHSRCVELAAKYQVPLIVRNSFDPEEGRRTRIMAYSDRVALEAPVVSGVTLDKNVARITVQGVPADGKTLSLMFARVAEAGVNVDIIVQNRQPNDGLGRFGFTVSKDDLRPAVDAITSLKGALGLEEATVSTQDGLAKVSAVGLGMRSHSGVARRVFETLHAEGIEVHMTSTSEIKISCVVDESQGEKAAKSLHDAFFADSGNRD